MRWSNWKFQIIIFAAAILVGVLYILASSFYFRAGFPLDDAWIHQTFARNLASRGEWSFNPGEPSAGSTSPLWTIILAFGNLIRIPTMIWTYGIGIFLLGFTGWIVFRYLHKFESNKNSVALFSALLVVSEWHLVWSAVSGMEILLQAFVILVVTLECLKEEPNWLLIGILTGLSVWIRPDGLTLLGPILFVLVVQKIHLKKWMLVFTPIIILVGAYLGFNYLISGQIWPNTFYAKQAEYAGLLQINGTVRYFQLLTIPLVGVGALLTPGFIIGVINGIKDKKTGHLAASIWVMGYILIYAMFLPVIYQHGRYLMPVIPLFMVLSLIGLKGISRTSIAKRVWFVLENGYIGALIITSILFLLLGLNAYRKDVAIIESEMVDTAKWIAANTESSEMVAAHDIGALGYFGHRRVIDLAGLINPSVLPILTNSNQLSQYLNNSEADYLMIFPDWYSPPLNVDGSLLYTSNSSFSPEMGGNNMRVFRLIR